VAAPQLHSVGSDVRVFVRFFSVDAMSLPEGAGHRTAVETYEVALDESFA
jgi:hypothetical protein